MKPLPVLVFAVLSLGFLNAQASRTQRDVLLTNAQIPFEFIRQFQKLGDRLQKPGKERVTLSGTLATTAGNSTVEVRLEKGGKASISGGSKTLTFDGDKLNGSFGNNDRALLESLADDLPETLMEYLGTGAGFQFVGTRFPDGKGTFCDIYLIPSIVRTDRRQTRTKRYCFDSDTLLLRTVEYAADPKANEPTIETRFSQWQTVNGQSVPGRITRLEFGSPVFTFEAQNIALSAKAQDGAFGETK